MNQTEDIKELVAALSKVQRKLETAKFNRINPYFKNRYADFASCMDVCRVPLSENGFSVMHFCETINDKLFLVTMLAHVSGQWIKSYFPINPVKMDSQSIGSAMTYAKRYSLSAMLGIVSDEEDDDAETANGRGKIVEITKQQTTAPSAKITPQQINLIKKLEDQLDTECKEKLYTWMEKTYQTSNFEKIEQTNFSRILSGFENAVKFINQNKLEVAHA